MFPTTTGRSPVPVLPDGFGMATPRPAVSKGMIDAGEEGSTSKPAAKGKCKRAAAESQGTAPKVTRESAENNELSLWPAGGAESLRLPSWPGAKAGGRSMRSKSVVEADGRSRWPKLMAEAALLKIWAFP